MTPYGLMFGRANYLVADGDRRDVGPRNWRLERIRDVEVLERTAAPPDGFDLQAYANRSFGIYQDDTEDVVLRILPRERRRGAELALPPDAGDDPQPDGAVMVTFRASGMRELAWHLFTWRDQVEILAPTRLRELMLEELRLSLLAACQSAHSGACVQIGLGAQVLAAA